jgi:hypothetical protein
MAEARGGGGDGGGGSSSGCFGIAFVHFVIVVVVVVNDDVVVSFGETFFGCFVFGVGCLEWGQWRGGFVVAAAVVVFPTARAGIRSRTLRAHGC